MSKVVVVGAGFVGSSAAYALMIQGVASEIHLVDAKKEKAEGEQMDLEHGLVFTREAKIRYGGYECCEGADVVVLTAGLSQKPGETRLDLVNKNAAIFKEMIPQIMRYAKNPIILVVANPVDVMTYLTMKLSGLARGRVFGSGTSLDSARLRYYLGEHFNIDPHSVQAFILGEHGDSEFPVWSRATVAGLHLWELDGFSQQVLDEACKKTKNAAYEIIAKKGATYYAIGLTISKIVRSILNNEQDIMPLSVYIDNYYDEGGVCLSVPCVVGREGVIRTMQLPLSDSEQQALHHSAGVLREIINKMQG